MNSERMRVVGLCGRSGSGKGYVCRIFNEMGIPSIDTDAVYNRLVTGQIGAPSACLTAIVDAFGGEVLDKNGNLNKRTLADIVFAPGNESRLQTLNRITHKYIKEKTRQEIALMEKTGVRVVLIDAPVLFESGFDALCDLKFYVCAPLDVLIRRICARDNITEDQAHSRLRTQMPDSTLNTLCDAVIVNDGFADVRGQVKEIVERFSLVG